MDNNRDNRYLRAAAYVDDLQAHGRYSFTGSEVSAALPRSKVAIEAAVRRLKKRGRLVVPRRGFCVIVPAEYRGAGAPPASWFIDQLMTFLAQPYYVGLLSAAAIHGAAHQQPMIFHVITDRPTRGFVVGRERVQFHMRATAAEASTLRVQTETGEMLVSTPEATAFDLIRYVSACGSLSNVATVIHELAERIDASLLLSLAHSQPTPEVQRLGYLLEMLGESRLTEAVAYSLASRRLRSVGLAVGVAVDGAQLDNRWRVFLNEPFEVEA